MTLAQIGLLIRDARRALNLTQAQVAASLRMSRATLSQLENGVIGELGVRKLAQVCDRVGLELIARPRHAALTLPEAYARKRLERQEALRLPPRPVKDDDHG